MIADEKLETLTNLIDTIVASRFWAQEDGFDCFILAFELGQRLFCLGL